MLKKEIIWREILYQALKNKKRVFTQKELAQKFNFSLSTVNNALKVPRKSGIIKVSGRNFTLKDPEKFLNLWATFRNLKKDIIYQTFVEKSPQEIEVNLPPRVIFGGYRAFIEALKETPADYDKVYVYAESKDLPIIKKRFPANKKSANLFVLKADSFLRNYGTKITPSCQTYVDIWNMEDWYAKEYYNSFREKLNAILS